MPWKALSKRLRDFVGVFPYGGAAGFFLRHLFDLNPGLGVPSWEGVAHAAWTRDKNRKAEVGSGV